MGCFTAHISIARVSDMDIHNNTDARRAVVKLFGERVKGKIHAVEKTGRTFRVYIEAVPLEPLSELPTGVYTYREQDFTVVVFEKNRLEVSKDAHRS